MLCAQKMTSAHYLDILNEKVFHQWIFDNARIHQTQIDRVVQGARDIIFTHGLATTESRPQNSRIGFNVLIFFFHLVSQHNKL